MLTIKTSEINKKINSEKILISLAVFMFAIVIGYNAFYSPKVQVITSESIISNLNVEENSTSSEEDYDSIKVNINTASESELIRLDGIGLSKAKNIIAYRESHGGFSSIREIMNVNGIGVKIFKNIKDNICI